MKKLNSAVLLLIIGLFTFIGSLIIEHFTNVPDLINGLMKGTAIGLMILAVARQKFRFAG